MGEKHRIIRAQYRGKAYERKMGDRRGKGISRVRRKDAISKHENSFNCSNAKYTFESCSIFPESKFKFIQRVCEAEGIYN